MVTEVWDFCRQVPYGRRTFAFDFCPILFCTDCSVGVIQPTVERARVDRISVFDSLVLVSDIVVV